MRPAPGSTVSRLVLRCCLVAVRCLALLVPARERRDWIDEWRAELRARYGHPDHRPLEPVEDLRGALADVLWHLKEEWNADMISHDLRFVLRSLARRPVFTAVLVLTLGLGIGANAVIFSAVDAVVLSPFDFPEPDRIVGIGTEYPRLDRPLGYFERISAPEYADIAAWSGTLEEVVAFDLGNRQVSGTDVPQNVFSGFWWGDPLPTLQLQPVVGRGFSRQDLESGERVAMVSDGMWRSRFGADPGVVGTTIRVDDEPYTLIGVFPPEVDVYGTELWLPMWADPTVMPRDRRQFNIIARVREGVSLEEVNAELETIARRTEEAHGREFDEYVGWRLVASTWTDVNVANLRPAAVLLLGAVGFVLLLVCANVASLLLARAADRRREISVRAALGAGRVRIVRQLFTESLALAALGGVVGVVLAVAGLGLLQGPGSFVPADAEIGLDGRMLGYAALVTLVAGIVFGAAPALQTARVDLQQGLGVAAGRSTGGAARRRWHGIFVAAEVALALVLLTGAGLLMQSFWRFQAVEPGVDTDDVLTMRLTLPWSKYEGGAITAFFEELVEHAGVIPGVRSAAAGSQYPPIVFTSRQFTLPGQEGADAGSLPTAYATLADDAYFETLGIPVLAGRSFDSRDTVGGQPVAVVNAEFVDRYMEGDPLGQRLKLGTADAEGPWYEVVGVVASTRNRGLQVAPEPEFFASVRQADGLSNQLFLLVRTEGDPTAVLPEIRDAVAALDPDQPIYSIRTLEEAFASGFATQRFAMQMLLAFSGLALVLAAVGIYGVVAHGVSERTRELGVRMALGAGRHQVRRLTVRQALVPVAIGLLLGLAAAVSLGQAMSSLLFEVPGVDPVTLAAVASLLAGVAFLASWVPARRASAVDPVVALRSE